MSATPVANHTTTIVLTGADGRMGAATARRLARNGWSVILVGRTAQPTVAIARELDVPYFVADFSDLSQVIRLACWLGDHFAAIDALLLNIDSFAADRRITIDGFERTVQVNYLAPYLLTASLIDILELGSTIVLTSSARARRTPNFRLETQPLVYRADWAYSDAKYAAPLFVAELDRRWSSRGVRVAAFDPDATFAEDLLLRRTATWSKQGWYRAEDGSAALNYLVDAQWTPGLV